VPVQLLTRYVYKHRYDDVVDPQDVYSLLGLTAFYNGFFGQCSKAFTRLESLTNIDEVRAASTHKQGPCAQCVA